MDSNDKAFTEAPTRLDKTLSWLKVSRDSWKEKTKESKVKLKIATLGIKRARESRDEIEKELHRKQKQLDQKDAEIAMLTKKLDQVTQEVETLKKKRSLHTQEGLNGIRIGTVL
jgi:hypothetical protein